MASIAGKHTNIIVSGRRKLSTPEAATKFNVQLDSYLKKLASMNLGAQLTFEDLDISQNPLPSDQIGVFFELLTSYNVCVQRLKLFGCPTFDDTACQYMANWLRAIHSPETAPWEIHLSDCAISTEGFAFILQAMEDNEAIPTINPRTSKPSPVYWRISNNYIATEAIQEKVDAGVLGQFTKGYGSKDAIPEGAKAKLLVKSIGDFEQRTGDPPQPENAPPPKEVRDWKATNQDTNWGAAASWGAGADLDQMAWMAEHFKQQGFDAQSLVESMGWQSGWGSSSWGSSASKGQSSTSAGKGASTWSSWGSGTGGSSGGKAAAGATNVKISPAAGKASTIKAVVGWKAQIGKGSGQIVGTTPTPKATAKAFIKPAVISPAAKTWNAPAKISPALGKGAAKDKGSAASRMADRSRTPAPKAKAKASAKQKLPPNWSEQHSDEWNIPFYWNEATGESRWDAPT